MYLGEEERRKKSINFKLVQPAMMVVKHFQRAFLEERAKFHSHVIVLICFTESKFI